MKIASQILKRIITVTFDSSLLLFPLCWYYLACFCTVKKKKKTKKPRKVFYTMNHSHKVKLNSVIIPTLVSKDTLPVQCKAFKTFAFKDKLKWENQQEAALANAKQFFEQGQDSKELLKSIPSKRKLIKVEKNIQKLEEKVATLGNQQDYTFDILLKSLMLSLFSDCHKDMTTIILLGSLTPPLTAKVVQSFSLMKLIYSLLRNRLLTKNLSHCTRICKSRYLRADE